jgi:hypothetical protein
VSAVVPSFPLIAEPGDLDRFTLLAETIYAEAEGEPDDGKLGVGYVIVNRGDDVHAVVLGKDRVAYGDGKPYEAWSCWNDAERARTAARLAAATGAMLEASWRAAASALWRLVPDPTHGATFYLNVPLTLKIRGGTLPPWAADPNDPRKVNERKVLAVHGRHHFLKG